MNKFYAANWNECIDYLFFCVYHCLTSWLAKYSSWSPTFSFEYYIGGRRGMFSAMPDAVVIWIVMSACMDGWLDENIPLVLPFLCCLLFVVHGNTLPLSKVGINQLMGEAPGIKSHGATAVNF